MLGESAELKTNQVLSSASVRYPFKANVSGSNVTITKQKSDYTPSNVRVTIEEKSGRRHNIGLITPHELWMAESNNKNELMQVLASDDFENFKPAALSERTFLLKDFTKKEWLLLSGYIHINVRDKYNLKVFAECPVSAWLDGELIQDNEGEPCIPAPHRGSENKAKDCTLPAGWKRWDILLNTHESIREGKVSIVVSQAYTHQLEDYRLRRKPAGIYKY